MTFLCLDLATLPLLSTGSLAHCHMRLALTSAKIQPWQIFVPISSISWPLIPRTQLFTKQQGRFFGRTFAAGFLQQLDFHLGELQVQCITGIYH